MRKAAAGLPHSKSLFRNIVRDSVGTARARNEFVPALRSIRGRYHFLLISYVGMSEHVYMLISEGPKCTPSLMLRVLSSAFRGI
jgi:REP element-mobilizing transposase RayT